MRMGNILSSNNHGVILLVFLLLFVFLLVWLFIRQKKNKFQENDIVSEKSVVTGGKRQSKTDWLSIVLGVILGFIIACVAGVIFLMVSEKSGSNKIIEGNNNKPIENEKGQRTEEEIYYLGILPLRSPSEMLERFAGVEKYLRDETGLNIKLRLYPTSGEVGGYTAVVKDVVNGDVSFAYLASVTTVQANGNGPVVPFACAQKKGFSTYQGDLVVKADSSYQTLEDLKGKKVSGTSKSSTSGNLMPLAMLKEKGIDEETYFDGGMMYLGSHDKATEAVLAGTVDACFINEATLNKYNANEKKLRSIWRHNPVPEFPFVVNTEKVTSEELVKVKDALLKMHDQNLSGIQSVNEKYEKWVNINWEDYLGIKDAIDKVHGIVFYDLDKWGKD